MIFAVVGCAGVEPNSLKQSDSFEVLLLRDPVTWVHTDKSLTSSVDYLHKLEPGEYTAAYEDGVGRYYLGGTGCLSLQVIGGASVPAELSHDVIEMDCGVYLPFDEAKPVGISVFMHSLRKRGARPQEGSLVKDGRAVPPLLPGHGSGAAIFAAIIHAQVGQLKPYHWNPPKGISREVFLVR